MQYRPFFEIEPPGQTSERFKLMRISPYLTIWHGLGVIFLLYCVWDTWGPIKLILDVPHVHKKWVQSF